MASKSLIENDSYDSDDEDLMYSNKASFNLKVLMNEKKENKLKQLFKFMVKILLFCLLITSMVLIISLNNSTLIISLILCLNILCLMTVYEEPILKFISKLDSN